MHMQLVKAILKILIMSHAYACSHIGSYWFNYRIARYDLSDELAHSLKSIGTWSTA